ncbi:DUF459 domain-containing protein [Devosia sp. ZB163]|uniref:SGNH/GDSL hydrolase family protein n=1 Tax=Devosia sp. ZB163 TaxID=3025938 RepID=UPI00236085D6|nr:DUF459 domain-containing protein [Devosia sp. ZB163]MDC9824979.1 DUF459 domain-containing protein [Devosia sp. ZB163]
MEKKPNRFVLWVIGLVVVALLLTDMLPAFAQSREAEVAAPIVQQHEDGRILVAQQEVQQQPRRRRTLMDLLFGEPEPVEQRAPVVEKPVVKKQTKAALPPAKPKVAKATGATRLAVFGDSMATDVGRALERFYAEDPNLEVIVQGVGSSSFVRPDFFDWPAEINKQIAANSFDIAVVMIGINDRQKMRLNDVPYGSLTPEWTTEYSARVTGVIKALRAASKPTIWVGLPPMEAPKFGNAMIQVNEIQRLAVFSGGAEFLDIYEKFATEEGGYTARGPDLNGNQVRMRKDDGIHFSAAGADKLAFYLSQSLKNYYRGGGTVGIEVADPLKGTDAQLMLRPPYQGLGQMKLLEVAGAVIPLTTATRRAADLVTAGMVEAVPVGFDITQMIQAPAGRADAFGVGKVENPTGR